MTPRLTHSCRAFGAALTVAIVLPASASAQASRTYVDRANGSDVNECLRETPCATFQRAHDMTTPNGEVNALTPGNYSSVIINRPITIDGNGTQSTISPFGAGVTVNIPAGAGKVVLRDIRINASANLGTHGIDVLRGATVVVDNLRIFGGSTAGIRVLNSQDPATRLIVDDTKIQGSGGPGLMIEPTGARVVRATIKNTSIDDNAGPAVRLRPAAGATARATVRNSELDANLNGVVADAGSGGTAVANVFRTAITDSGLDPVGSGVGIYADGANATVRIARNEIQHNQRGLRALNSGKILSAGDNDIVGNVVNGAPTGNFPRS
jgi:hypothetical protein